jgi:phage-related protein
VGSSLEDLRGFPEPVREAIGYALFAAQQGRKAPSAKPMKGIVRGAGVLQISDRHDGDSFRAAYTVSFPSFVYVLHAFQKKSRSGIRTARRDVALIRARLETARTDYESRRL